jgi:hypothetical protein
MKPDIINHFTQMNDSDYKIVRITNISDFDFTGDIGARFAGRDFFIPAGGSLLVPQTVGDHLAMHLARQILIRKAPTRDANQLDGKGSDRPLWDDSAIDEIKAKIMVNVFEEEKKNPLSEAERLAQRVDELNKAVTIEGGNADASGITPTDVNNSALVYKDKAEVIAELEKKGASFDARLSKAKLEELLAI